MTLLTTAAASEKQALCRLAAIETLAKNGIPATVMVAPLIPAINEHELPKILEAARNAGATSAGFVVLRLPWAVAPLFERWLAPFRDLGVSTITIRNTGGTDHLSFDAVGLPGFQFIQDPLDYFTVTHHSNMDVYDHAVAGDLMQASAIIAALVYDAATRPELLPRKPLPKPQVETEH